LTKLNITFANVDNEEFIEFIASLTSLKELDIEDCSGDCDPLLYALASLENIDRIGMGCPDKGDLHMTSDRGMLSLASGPSGHS